MKEINLLLKSLSLHLGQNIQLESSHRNSILWNMPKEKREKFQLITEIWSNLFFSV